VQHEAETRSVGASSADASEASSETSEESSHVSSDDTAPDRGGSPVKQAVTQPAAELHGHLDALFAGGSGRGNHRDSQAMRLKAMQLLQRQPPAAQMPASQGHAEQAAKAAGPALQLPSPHGRRSSAGGPCCALPGQPPGATAPGRPDSRQSNGSTMTQQEHCNPVTVRGRAHLRTGELALYRLW
jgi:hypothetical protein